MEKLYLKREKSYKKVVNYKNDLHKILHILSVKNIFLALIVFEIYAFKDKLF